MGKEQTQKTIEAIFGRWEQDPERTVTAEFRQIIDTNWERDRVDNWLAGAKSRTVEQYLELVKANQAENRPYLNKLQTQQDHESWGSLLPRLLKWVYNYLVRKKFRRDGETAELAETYAQEAAAALYRAYFPYDVTFDQWAHTIVLNTCRRLMRHAMRQQRKGNSETVQLEDHTVEEDSNLDPVAEAVETAVASESLRRDILDAIDSLKSTAAREVLKRHYFEEVSLADIAREMGKTPGSVHSIHFRGLRSLRKILAEKGYTKD